MLFPLRDDNPVARTPVLTYALIAVNAVVFLGEMALGPALDGVIRALGVVPADLLAAPLREAPTLITSMFLHGGWMHLIGNMWFLYIFGDNIEDRLGRPGFAAFYVASGVAAGLLQVLVAPASTVPTIGASGAIAGVLGAYAVLYPHARVVTVLWLFIFVRLIRVPAFLFLGVWFGMQALSGLGSLGATGGGVAWWAHIGGFAVGGGVALVMRHLEAAAPPPRPPRPRYAPPLRTPGANPGVIIRLDDRRRRPPDLLH